MKLVNRRSATMLAMFALGMRAIIALLIDSPHLMSSGWISVLLAGILTAPLALCMDYIERKRGVPGAELMRGALGRVYCGVLCAFLLFETGYGTWLLSTTAAYMSLGVARQPMYTVICVVAIALACAAGARPVVGSVQIGLRLFIFAILIVVLVQLNSNNMRWLTPILGPGAPALMRSTVGLSGVMTGLIPLWLLVEPEGPSIKRLFTLKVLIVVVLFATLMVLRFNILTPPMPSGATTRWFQLNRLLTSGRMSQQLQIFTIPLWYGMNIAYISFTMILSIHTLMLALPALKQRWAVFACALIALAVALADVNSQELIRLVNEIRWPVCALPIFAYALVCAFGRKKEGALQ